MKVQHFTLSLVIAIFCYSNSYAQWESTSGSIIASVHRVWNIRIAPDSSVWALAMRDLFPPTNYTPKVYRSIDQGSTWDTYEITAGLSNYTWDISPVSKDTAYVALDTLGLYRTLDGGLSWSRVDSFPFMSAWMVHFFNQDEGWVFGLDSAYYSMSVTSDGGNSWTKMAGDDWVQPNGTSLPSLDTTEYIGGGAYSTAFYDYLDDTIMIGTNKGTYWKSSDKGYNWTRHLTPLADSGIMIGNIAMKDGNTFMVAGDFPAENSNPSGPVDALSFTTKDGGNTWVMGKPPVTPAGCHYLPNSDSVFIIVGHRSFSGVGGSGTVISYDYGETWEKIDNTSLLTVDFLDENIGYGACGTYSWAIGSGEFFKWNYVLDPPVSIDESVRPEWVRLLPNPVSTNLTLEIDNEFRHNDLAIEIIALNGQILSTYQSGYSYRVKIPVRDLPKGLYFLRITGDQKSITKKFVKE